ncbi:glycoside hydrolase family 16 protein [Nocardioides nanhaiensis]|uniref:GH16 domain-containing protein n=1 Tax=Nocardioides nanhaiensis TaxID=1476871 RepID=A0ABP8VXQ4_9ACTN
MSTAVRPRQQRRVAQRWAALVAACGVALSLLSSFAVATAPPGGSAARSSLLQLAAPVAGPTTVTLRGRASTRAVVLQRRTDRGWQRVRRVPVRQGRFAVRMPRTDSAQRVRVQADGQRSAVRVVPPRATTAPAQVRAPQDACGARPRKADGTYWSCTFVDDFDGTELDPTKWVKQTIFSSGTDSTYACYHEDNVAVAGGSLHLTLRYEEEPKPCIGSDRSTRYTAGSVMTYGLFSQQHGRFEARIRNTATHAPGLQEAFWLWPDEFVKDPKLMWPAAGEIDISETYSAWSWLSIPSLHYGAGGAGEDGVTTAWDCAAPRGAWNIYALEWSAEKLEVFVNGRSCLVNTDGADIAFQHPYIVALTQLLGTTGNEPSADTPLPATMSVDHVRVWR